MRKNLLFGLFATMVLLLTTACQKENDLLGNGQKEQAKEAYKKLMDAGSVASDCIQCGQCESVCPQHINIIEKLKECDASLR